MKEEFRALETADGPMTTFVVRPERGGPHPLVVFLMDAAGIREEVRNMARRLSTSGYYVMLPNLFHRSGVEELADDAPLAEHSRLLGGVTGRTVDADCAAVLTYAQADPDAACDRIGTVGYCMSGQYAVRLAAARPDIVRAAASYHGVSLVTDEADSPHRLLGQAKAEFYFGHAELDAYAPMAMAVALRDTIAAEGINGEVEIYAGLDHGFVFPSRKAGMGSVHAPYDLDGDLRHWERLIALFRRTIG